jgi:hypothetical protein
MIDARDLVDWTVGKHTAFCQDDQPVDDRQQRVQVVRNQQHGDAEVVDERAHQVVEAARGGRVEP